MQGEKVQQFSEEQLKKNLPDLRVGDIVKVHQIIPASESIAKGKKKSDKERVQVFEGVVLASKHGRGIQATFTVRKIISGIGVEKTYPLHSPHISKIEIISRSKVRRAKLYYLRQRAGKKAKLKRKQYVPGEEIAEETKPAPETQKEKQAEAKE